MTRSTIGLSVLALILAAGQSHAALITDPDDTRTWQGAGVGTFAQLIYGSNTSANRQLIIDTELLDDGIFDAAGFTAATLMATPWALGTGGSSDHLGGGMKGISHDSTGTGSLSYGSAGVSIFETADLVDNMWFQSSDTVGDTVFDLGAQSTKAAVFNTIDHGPLPGEAIESSVYLSNDLSTWTQAVVERVWLEGFEPILGIKWDGFVFAVGTGTEDTFRYASVVHGGPGSLLDDGDDEINGIMGLESDFVPVDPNIPEPASLIIWSLLALMGIVAAWHRG